MEALGDSVHVQGCSEYSTSEPEFECACVCVCKGLKTTVSVLSQMPPAFLLYFKFFL